MSHSNNFVRIQELTQTHITARQEYEQQSAEIAKQQALARKEYDLKNAELNKQLQAKLSNYNTVVMNTLRKFSSDSWMIQVLMDKLIVPYGSTFVDLDLRKGEYVFESKGKQQRIHVSLLQNDPMTVASHTRRAIRQFQDDRRTTEYENAKKDLQNAKNVMARKKKEVEKAQLAVDRVEYRNQQYEAKAKLRTDKKLKSQISVEK
jgi:hypothetical protein